MAETFPVIDVNVSSMCVSGVTNLWYGLYIKDNRLVMDDFPMTQRMDPFIYDNIVAKQVAFIVITRP